MGVTLIWAMPKSGSMQNSFLGVRIFWTSLSDPRGCGPDLGTAHHVMHCALNGGFCWESAMPEAVSLPLSDVSGGFLCEGSGVGLLFF